VLDRTEIAELVSQLVSIESVNPTLVPGGSGEAAIGRFVADWLERHGIETEYEEVEPGRANVVGRVRGTGGGRTLLLNAHMDTVDLGGPDGGTTPRVDGDRLYGRGSYDMKSGLAAIMLAAARAADLRLAGDVVVTAVSDEEDRSLGSERIAATVQADAAIVAEPTELRLVIAHRGFCWLELETSGVAAHGSRYDLGVDAIARMGHVLVALERLDVELRVGKPEHPLLGHASLHASLIEGGTELSTYPDRCVVKVERRTLPGETVEAVETQIRAAAPDAEVRTLFVREPLETTRDAEIVERLLANARPVLGSAPEVVGAPWWADAALFSAAGIPTVIFGAGGEGAHAETEWVDLADVERVTEIVLATIADFCA
jgi:acetylornithine deacetylase